MPDCTIVSVGWLIVAVHSSSCSPADRQTSPDKPNQVSLQVLLASFRWTKLERKNLDTDTDHEDIPAHSGRKGPWPTTANKKRNTTEGQRCQSQKSKSDTGQKPQSTKR